MLLKGIYREVFTPIAGSYIDNLTNSPSFPNSPASAELMTNLFETSSKGQNDYGQRFRTRLLPPVTGSYTFWLAADDTASLFLGTNDTPGSAVQIASSCWCVSA